MDGEGTIVSAAPASVGSAAPAFTLPDQVGRPRSLESLTTERAVLLTFFPFAFSGICTGELREIRDELSRFDNDRVHVVAISCDPMFALRAWDDQEAFFFPLLSDFWPHGEVARSYGVWHEEGGFAARGTFLVDTSGTVAWTLINEPGRRRSFEGVDAAVAALPGPSELAE
ncbi:MAG: peroxiredoxin [Dermatophilaceae bacterium]